MLSKRTAILVGSGVAVVALSFFLGRTTAPARVKTVEKTVTVEREVEVEKRAELAATEHADTHEDQWRTRTVYKHDGTVIVTREAEQRDEHKTATQTSKSAEKTVTQVSERLVYKDRLVEAAAPRWAFGASVGAGTDLRMRYQGEGAMRLVGGLWLTVQVQPVERAALAGVRFEF